MTTPWTSRCESGNCVEVRTVGDLVEVRDTEHPEQAPPRVSARAWAEHEAALRTEVLKVAARGLLADAKRHAAMWGRGQTWDRGFVAGMEHAAYALANSIDRPETLTEVRNDAKWTSDGD
jgi:hypothetical protein